MVSDRVCANYICLKNCRSDREKYCRKCVQGGGHVFGNCANCNQLFPYYATKINRRFCSVKCSAHHHYMKFQERNKEYTKNKYIKKQYDSVCNKCSKPYVARNKRSKYCCKKCSAQGSYKQRAEAMKLTKLKKENLKLMSIALGIFGTKQRVKNNPYVQILIPA